MFNCMMFPHDLIKRVPVESSHEEEDHAGALPPGVASLAVLWEEESRRETQRHGFSSTRALKADKHSQALSQRE